MSVKKELSVDVMIWAAAVVYYISLDKKSVCLFLQLTELQNIVKFRK